VISAYCIQAGHLVPSEKNGAGIFVYSGPLTETEKGQLLQEFSLDPIDIDAINDPDEIPRIEASQDGLLIIWNWPDNVSCKDTIQFEVSTIGLFLGRGKAVAIIPRGQLPVAGREFKRLDSVEDFVLRVLLYTIHQYQGHLKAIKMMSTDLESKVVTSMENKYLLQMFELGESLVYYHNALDANSTILTKLRGAVKKLKLTEEQIDFLDDVIIENLQAVKQASIYSTVLSGLMDARGTIVNNNMNVLLKNLTIINVVFLPLNLIASIGGMSEFSMMTQGIDWRISYPVFMLTMATLGWLTWWWVVKLIDRNSNRNGQRGR
jgi:magnesium transporter